MTIIDKIKNLIAQDKTNFVFKELLELNLDADTKNIIILLSSQWNSAKNDYNLNETSSKDWLQIKARINYALMQIITNIPQHILLSEIENRIDKKKKINTVKIEGNTNLVYQDANNTQIFINSNNIENINKLKILVIHSLKNDDRLTIDREINIFKNTLSTSTIRDKIELNIEFCLNVNEIINIILKTEPSIIHFHNLFFEDQTENLKYLHKNTFAKIFALTSKNTTIRLVLISACNSYDYANEIAYYVDYSIGMQGDIPEIATLAFTKSFYEMLFEGEDIDYAFNAGIIALKKSRIEFISSIPLAEIPVLLNKKGE